MLNYISDLPARWFGQRESGERETQTHTLCVCLTHIHTNLHALVISPESTHRHFQENLWFLKYLTDVDTAHIYTVYFLLYRITLMHTNAHTHTHILILHVISHRHTQADRWEHQMMSATRFVSHGGSHRWHRLSWENTRAYISTLNVCACACMTVCVCMHRVRYAVNVWMNMIVCVCIGFVHQAPKAHWQFNK